MEMFKIQKCGHKHDLHWPNATLTGYQKGVYDAGTKSYSILPPNIKILHHDIKVFSWNLEITLSSLLVLCRRLLSTETS
jgi:hypothetical protein